MRRMLAALLALVALLPAAERDEAPRVLVVVSYHAGQPWADSVCAGLSEALQGAAEPVFVHLDHKRFPWPMLAAERLAWISGLRQASRAQAVVAVDDLAWDLAVRHRAQVAPGLPIVFCGVNYYDPAARPANATGVVESFDPAGGIALAAALQPQLARIVVVNDATETGLANRRKLEALPAAAWRGLQTLQVGAGTWAETEAVLRGLDPRRDAVLLLCWNLDASGQTQSHEAAALRARAVSAAPIYGVWDFQLGRGIVGGSLLDGRVHGREAGELVRQILAGTPADALPVRTAPRTRLVVDAELLDAWGIPRERVPAAAAVVNHRPGFWERHGQVVLAAAAVVAAQAATIAWLILVMRRRARAEAARREAEARLRQAGRLQAVGQLAAGIAHDFNNVLTAILGHADLLAMRLGDDHPLHGHAQTIIGAAQRAAGTVRNLLLFTRGAARGGGSCEVNAIIEETVALLSHALGRSIAIGTALSPGCGAARLEASELQQVLVNLALNARDAMPQGGTLAIASARRRLGPDEAAALGLPAPGEWVQISVRDSGSGIPPEILERIFDPFFTTKPPGQGTGLGLSVVHGIVSAAGGAVRVESRVGEGTTFHLWLPPGAEAPARRRTTVVQGVLLGRTVLLVDDDQVVRLAVRELLRSLGAGVVAFADPREAESWFLDHSDEIHAALIDGDMPQLPGWQLAARLRDARPDLRIVALTGARTPEAEAAWQAAGVSAILEKPVTSVQLAAALADAPEAPPAGQSG